MTHTLTYFEHVPLPVGVPIDDLSTGQVDSSLMDSVGSVFNYHGSLQTHPRRTQIVQRGKYIGSLETRITADGDTRVDESGNVRVTARSRTADLVAQVDELKSMRGAWGQLWRRRIADNQLTWKRCRLRQVRHIESVENAERVSEVESTFESAEIGWRGPDLLTVSGAATAGTWLQLRPQNGGALAVEDATLRIECTSGTITAVEVTGEGIHLGWTGALAAGQTLVIDSGACTVLKDGLNAYSGFTVYGNHSAQAWLVLARGNNLLEVRVSGGGADIEIAYYLLWP